MNQYKAMKDRHSKEFNEFPMFFAFDKAQFDRGMRKLGLEPHELDKIINLKGTGGYIRESDKQAFVDLDARTHKEMDEAIASDPDGMGFIYDMFLYELNNHEYGYTYDIRDTLETLGFTVDEIEADPRLQKGLEAACNKIMEAYDW